ncbi:MAG TPA: HAD hydrolase-like protein, partial [Bacillota bacterium]|nr:HAD hydrolase-like protein [Bacillota bacterium]
MGISPERTAVLGDQLFTDVMAAKRLGIRAIVVTPIKDKKSLLFRIKRACERPLLRKYKNTSGING